jgi:formylglycine-generating enzyme required for sulfatase activity
MIYRAFLSYSHSDTKWAKWLHGRLEDFRIEKDLSGRATSTGPIPNSLRPIFRDRDEFTAGHSLTEQTLTALDESAALIVLCSPAAAQSRYVNEEVRLFKQRHSDRPVIPVIAEGKPGDAGHECLAPAVRYKVSSDGTITEEPIEALAADLRDEGDGPELALAKVIARLLGLSTDDVFQRAQRDQRRRRKLRNRITAALVLLVLATAATAVGWWKQDFVREQYQWLVFMHPSVLKAEKEKEITAKPGSDFKECANGCPTMIVVPAGKFTMGSPKTEEHREEKEGPQHEVKIAAPFAVSKFDVTFDEWDRCRAAGACPQVASNGWGGGNQPVINVSWSEAKGYVAWLSRLTGKGYRLLSEAEFEYAARAGSTTRYPWGDEIGTDNANCADCNSKWARKQPAPVGSFKPNAFDLYDMHGNVFDWIEDCWNDNYQGAPTDGSAWTMGDCNGRVIRGGGWDSGSQELSSAHRGGNRYYNRNVGTSFRVARTLTP